MLYDRLTWICAAIIGIAAVVWASLAESIQRQRVAIQQAHEQSMIELRERWQRDELRRERKWIDEETSKQAAWDRENAQRRAVRKKELEEALGGAVGAALKNPELSIREMLLELGRACAPPGTDVQVTVDRFTEFDTAFGFDTRPERREIESLLRCFLWSGGVYVETVRVIQGNELLWEINRRRLDEVTDWAAVKLDDLLDTKNTTNVLDRATGSLAAGGPDDEQSVALDQRNGLPDARAATESVRAQTNRVAKSDGETWSGSFLEYDEAIRDKALERARALLSQDYGGALTKIGKVKLRFREHADGRITGAEIVETEVGNVVATTCLRGVLTAAPFPGWSDAMRKAAGGEFRDVVVTWTVDLGETRK